ncbi:MAG: zinc ABC transporter substrate-binding protein [Oscillospiraceae bacterium]|nr:zinc ABC transporter substrate-binding protein [Oscillospiraceae bacterium]
MKKFLVSLLCLTFLSGCGAPPESGASFTAAATAYPVYLLAREVMEGVEGAELIAVVNQPVSCLHDYTLTISNMKAIEQADLLLLNGVGLEEFLGDALGGRPAADCSEGVPLLETDGEAHHDHEHEHSEHDHGEHDPHIWMDPERAARMTENIAAALAQADPDHGEAYLANGAAAAEDLRGLKAALSAKLDGLSCRKLITFHDGFAYLADAFDLELLASIEEEEGSEASAKDIVEIVAAVETYGLPAIFVEANGSDATANAISRECGAAVHTLSMLMSGPEGATYGELMTGNIEVLLEALA